MTIRPRKENGLKPSKLAGLAITVAALIIVLIHVRWPRLAIDAITLTLLVIALIPWLRPIFKSPEFPGGWKVEYQDLQKAAVRAEQAGLLASLPAAPAQPQFSFQRVAETDPNLALAGLRIEIEKRLVALAEKRGINVRGRGIAQLLRALTEAQASSRSDLRICLSDFSLFLRPPVDR